MPRRKSEATSELIQDSVVKLIASKTYRGITMTDIAGEANIAKRTLYKYYPSKWELFAGVFEKYQKMLIAAEKNENFQHLSYGEALQKILVVYHHFVRENENFMRLFWLLSAENSEETRELIGRWTAALGSEMAALLSGKEASGLFQDSTPQLVTHMLSAVNKGIYLQGAKDSELGIGGFGEDALLNLFCAMLDYCARDSVHRDSALDK